MQKRRRMRTTIAALALLSFTAGCNPTYAPLVRAVQYGAPARLEQGRVELGGTAGGVVVPMTGGPHLAVGLTDWAAVEAGGNFFYDEWVMGFVGTRFSFTGDRKRRAYLIGDLELGVGGGLGGQLNGNQGTTSASEPGDDLTALQRVAWGGYQGAGLGVRIRWFSIYGRVRVEESKATNIPLTLWPSASVGMEFRVNDRVALNLGTGVMGYTNSRDSAWGMFYQVGMVLFFDSRTPAPVRPVEVLPDSMRPLPQPLPPARPLPPPGAEPWAPRPPLDPVPPPPPLPDPFEEDDTYDQPPVW
jgi:hypothetical protein